MNVAQLTIEMAANVARLKTDMAAARNTVEGTMNSIKKAAGAAQVALGAIGVGLSVNAFAGWIKGAINAADEANKLSQKIGIAVKEIGGLQLAFSQGGVDAESMSSSLAKLNKNIAAGDSAFKTLGVATKNADGSLRSTTDVLADIADRFAGTENNANKTAMAIDLFGKSGAALIPVLNAGGDSIREFQVLAQQLGLTLSEETALAAEKFNDTLELISMGSRGIANQVMAELLPTLQSLAGEFLNLMTQGGNLKGIADVISAGLKGLFTVAAVGVEIFRTLGNTIGATAAGIVAFASGDFAGAASVLKELGKDIRTNWTGTLESLDRLWNQSGNTAIEAAAKITSGSMQSGKAMDEAAKAAKKLADEHDKARKAADDLVASIAFETETMQMSNLEREIANNLLKLEKTGLQENTEEYRAYADAIRLATIENEGIKQRIKLEKEGAEKRKKIEEDYAREVEQINFQIGQSLTDALINGGQTAKEFLINMFKTLILRPILQPIIQGGTSMVMGALGMGASGSAMATPGSLSNTAGLGQIGSLASTMNTLYTGLAGGFTAVSSAIGGGLASLAAATESASLASFAAGMQGASLAPGLAGPTTAGATGAMGAGATAAAFAQGAAGIGAGVLAGEYISGGKSLVGGNSLWTTGGGAAAGAAIGTAILPGIGTAIGGLIGGIVGGIANAGWGSGAKEMQGSGMASGTITGGGLQEAQFYQNWKKEGGWFKSDQYGRDTQAMSAELVTYINDATQAIRDSGKDYATLLQLSADGIDAVAVAFDFAVGSMDQLTENLGNTLDDYANKVADAILAGTNFGKAGETSYETIQRLVNSLNLVNPIFDTLGIKMFEMSAAGGAAAGAFIDLMGGIEAFNQATDFYYQNFYTEAERIAKTTENLTKVFEAMNVELPTSIESYRALVDATRAAGNDVLLANLLKLAPTFLQIANATKETTQVLETTVDTNLAIQEKLRAEQEKQQAILQDRMGLETQLLQMLGRTSDLRLQELRALDPSNRALQETINRLQDLQNALKDMIAGATSEISDALSLNQQLANQARQSAQAYRDAAKSLRETADEMAGVGAKEAYTNILASARTGDVESMRALPQFARALQDVERSQATSALDFAIRSAQIANDMSQVASVADVLGISADYQADLLDVQRGILEAIRDSLQSGNATVESINAQTEALKNIGDRLEASQSLATETYATQSGLIRTTLVDGNGNVISTLDANTVLNLQGLSDQNTAFGNSITGQTTTFSGLSQDQVDKLIDLESIGEQQYTLTDLIEEATAGNETLTAAVLEVLGSNTTINGFDTLLSNNASIISLLGDIKSLLGQIGEIDAGASGVPADYAASVQSQYKYFLKRAATEQEVKDLYAAGKTETQIKSQLEASMERRVVLIKQYYNSYLGRDPSKERLTYWQNYLPAGNTEQESKINTANTVRKLTEMYQKGQLYADGGFYPGGMALVGEEGPELINFSRPGQVYTASETGSILSNDGGTADEVRQLRVENQAQSRAIVMLQSRMTRLLERWDGDGLPEERVVTA